MSQRESGYARVEHDLYETPPEVTQALLPHLNGIRSIWEPACASGKMVRVFHEAGIDTIGTDIRSGDDFLLTESIPAAGIQGICTNPPYSIAQEFIERALDHMRPAGLVAMLLRCDFDHAKSRRHLFADCPAFSKKLVLTKRIRWIEGSTGSPSFNHAWFLWNWLHEGPPVLAYA